MINSLKMGQWIVQSGKYVELISCLISNVKCYHPFKCNVADNAVIT